MATPFIYVVIQVERETVMTVWRLHWGFRELGQYLVIYCLSFVIGMLNLFIVILFLCRYDAHFFYLFVIFTCIQMMLVSFHVLNYD